ncbi:MAG: hypothetical protein MMC33_006738 [Icmadophila ericetorum]|nr:hypothetical protein [Icmadophila ericetorum]
MEASPLVQQARPSFQPKICQLYEQLFIDEEYDHSEGFWSEFFLLKPDRGKLHERLETLDADGLLHFQHETQQIFIHAVERVGNGRAPSDEVALDTLIVFLSSVLSKRYTNPSSDIITVLAGLDEVDAVFSDFANAIETLIRTGRSLDVRRKAIEVALTLASGAYQTSLVSYFTHRDLFPALMKYMQDSEINSFAFEPFLLLGLLANYNKFEYRNPYRLRLEDFVNEAITHRIVYGFSKACAESRDRYTAIQEDLPEGWNLSAALTYIGLGMLAPVKVRPATASSEDSKEQLAGLPGPEAAVLLAAYDFAIANKLFCYSLIACPSVAKGQEAPFSSFLSLSSYILHHAYRSTRATLYGILNLTTLRIIIEDPVLCKRLCTDESSISVRLCRQRQPFLPPTPGSRPAAAVILDITIDAINHNLRRRLDLSLYLASIHLMHRLVCCLSQTNTRLVYHWSLLWQSLLTLIRFLTTYSTDITTSTPEINALITPLLQTIALAIASGNTFFPTPTAYDDLIYKLVENSAHLSKFKEAYKLSPSPSITTPTTSSPTGATAPIDILLAVSTHYTSILDSQKETGKLSRNLIPSEVYKLIRKGYETLDVPEREGLDSFERWREGEVERGWLKRVARGAVEDGRRLVGGL